MSNWHCITCGIIIESTSFYHIHNINFHSKEELSATILKLCFKAELVPTFPTKEQLAEDSKLLKNSKRSELRKCNGEGFSREFMDEVIELGPIGGDDNLTVQSLFLKSNFTPNSRHIIEVQEKNSQDVIRVLSKELNASVVHFQDDVVSAGTAVHMGKEMPFLRDKIAEPDNISMKKKQPRRKLKKISSNKRKRRENKRSCGSQELTWNRLGYSGVNNDQTESSKSDMKIVLRSGRTIKTNPKYEDFVYYDNFKENTHKISSVHSLTETQHQTASCKDNDPKITLDSLNVLQNLEQPVNDSVNKAVSSSFPSEPFGNKLLDLFAEELGLGDWSFKNELDISIEDLDLSGFDDFGGSLPENQILTIENLLQELDGGGSIEISNIIKENNVDSDTLVLDALSQNVGNIFSEGLKDDASVKSQSGINSNSESALNTCTICNKSYICKKSYDRHMEKYHTGKKMLYKCTTCNSVFTFLSAFEKHIRAHNPLQSFICEVCGRSFKNLTNLKIHFALHKKTKTFQCHVCPNKYYLKYSYLSHLKIHGQDKFHCEKCDKYFSQKSHFNKHVKKHSTGRYLGFSQDYRCNYCKEKKSLDALKSIYGASEFNCSTCRLCGKGSYKKYLLENQNYSKSEESVVPLKRECKICKKHVKNLQKHVREIHLSNPVVQCNICNQPLKKSSLTTHKLRAHNGISAKCDHCDKTFKNALALNEHLNKVKKMLL